MDEGAGLGSSAAVEYVRDGSLVIVRGCLCEQKEGTEVFGCCFQSLTLKLPRMSPISPF